MIGRICAGLALAGLGFSTQAVAFGDANEGCHVLVESQSSALADDAVNDIGKLNGLNFTLQFTRVDPARGQKNSAGINISIEHDRLALDCVYISTDPGTPQCIATHVVGHDFGIPDMAVYQKPDGLTSPLHFAIDWTPDGTLNIASDAGPKHSMKLAGAPTKLYMQSEDCQVEYKASAEK